jgi:hypothetical protein
MTTRIGAVAACMSLASPDKGGGMTIPSLNGVPKPVFEDLHIIDMVSLQCSADENPLHGFGHVEPRARTGRVQEPNAVLTTPTHQIAAVMACQVIQNEQYAQGRVHPIQLLGGWERVPILPPPPVWDLFWRGWTLLENGGKLVLEPGMQNGIRTLIDWFRSQFTRGRSKQRQHFASLATNILMVLACRDPLRLK